MQLHNRVLKYIQTGINIITNECVVLCINLALDGKQCPLCSSINYICFKYGHSKSCISVCSYGHLRQLCDKYFNDNEQQMGVGSQIRELISLKGRSDTFLTDKEYKDII